MTDNPNVYQGQLGTDRPNDVQISADGSTIYAAGADGNLYVYSAATGALEHTWAVGTQLGGMDISPDGTFAVVTELTPVGTWIDQYGDESPIVTVHKIDLTTGAVTNFDLNAWWDQGSFADAAVLSDGTVLLTQNIRPGWGGYMAPQMLDLSTGSFTKLNESFYSGSILSPTADGSSVLIGEAGTMPGYSHLFTLDGGFTNIPLGTQGSNVGMQAMNEQTGWIALGDYVGGVQLYNQTSGEYVDLTSSHPEWSYGGVAGVAFDQSGQYLFVLDANENAILQLSTTDWTTVAEYPVGADVAALNSWGNGLIVAPDLSYFTVVTEHGLIEVDPTAPPPPSEAADTLIGTPGNDTIDGLGGNDIIKGYGGDDVLHGGLGDDSIQGGDGVDVIAGDGGNDTLIGGAGGDTLTGGDGWDVLVSNEIPTGAYGVYGGGGPEVDNLSGGAGDDRIYAGYGDNVDGGDHVYGDTLYLDAIDAPVGFTFDFSLATQVIGGGTITGIERIGWIAGSNFDDHIDLSAEPAIGYDSPSLNGMGGDDTLIAGVNTGMLDGGDGNDFLDGRAATVSVGVYGGAGNDTLYGANVLWSGVYGGDGNDVIVAYSTTQGGDGNDSITLLGNLGDVGYVLVTGDAGDDTITGSDLGNSISGGVGADHIDGGAGNDYLYSGEVASGTGWNNDGTSDDTGSEHDVLIGGGGDDHLAAGFGDDVDGGSGTDVLRLNLTGAPSGVTLDTADLVSAAGTSVGGGTIQNIEQLDYLRTTDFADTITVSDQPGAVTLDAGAGNDVIVNKSDNAVILGGSGEDTINSTGAGAIVDGGDGNDVITLEGAGGSALGDGGDDVFMSTGAGNYYSGGDGFDTVDYSLSSTGVTANLGSGEGPGGDTYYYAWNIEGLRGSDFADTLTGSFFDNQLSGGGGDDILTGGQGNDTLAGGAGNDTFVFARFDGKDVVTDLASGDGVTINGYSSAQSISQVGADVVVVLSAYDQIAFQNADVATVQAALHFVPPPSVTLNGTAGADTLAGGDGDDTLNGLGGNDLLDGGFGADTMIGGAGNDVYYVDDIKDVIVEARRGGTDSVNTAVSFTLGTGVEVEKMAALWSEDVNLTGNEFAQAIDGNLGNNILAGMGGADTLTGGGGSDTFLFGTGGGKDKITDFSTGDILQISGYTAAQSIVQSGSTVIVTLSRSDVITLQNTNVATVQAGLHFDTGGTGGGGGGTPGGPTEGDDTLTGTTRADTINGLGGNDTILGLAGSDKLLGGDGNDTLRGGLGADTLTGGAGADLFVFEAGGNNDKILDFVSGTDKIDLHLLSGVTSADVKTALSAGNTVISIDANHDGRADFTITLTGVSHVDTGDFIFA